MRRTSGQTVSVSMHHGKVYSPDDEAPISLMRRRLLPSSPSSGCEPAAASGNGVRVAGDWEQRVDRPVFRLVDAACVWFPHVYGEGRRLKGSVKKPLPGADARLLDDHLDASKYYGTRPPGRICLRHTPNHLWGMTRTSSGQILTCA